MQDTFAVSAGFLDELLLKIVEAYRSPRLGVGGAQVGDHHGVVFAVATLRNDPQIGGDYVTPHEAVRIVVARIAGIVAVAVAVTFVVAVNAVVALPNTFDFSFILPGIAVAVVALALGVGEMLRVQAAADRLLGPKTDADLVDRFGVFPD